MSDTPRSRLKRSNAFKCPKPSSLRRKQLIRECPVLANIEPRQIKVWFQNRRCREKQKKESGQLQTVNIKLSAMNKLLMEENERLQKQVSQPVGENRFMRQQLQSASTAPQHSLRDANSPAGLALIAEETLAEFLSKATGTAVDWVQMHGMKISYFSLLKFLVNKSLSRSVQGGKFCSPCLKFFSLILLFLAWSGFRWDLCHFAKLQWSGGSSMWSC